MINFNRLHFATRIDGGAVGFFKGNARLLRFDLNERRSDRRFFNHDFFFGFKDGGLRSHYGFRCIFIEVVSRSFISSRLNVFFSRRFIRHDQLSSAVGVALTRATTTAARTTTRILFVAFFSVFDHFIKSVFRGLRCLIFLRNFGKGELFFHFFSAFSGFFLLSASFVAMTQAIVARRTSGLRGVVFFAFSGLGLFLRHGFLRGFLHILGEVFLTATRATTAGLFTFRERRSTRDGIHLIGLFIAFTFFAFKAIRAFETIVTVAARVLTWLTTLTTLGVFLSFTASRLHGIRVSSLFFRLFSCSGIRVPKEELGDTRKETQLRFRFRHEGLRNGFSFLRFFFGLRGVHRCRNAWQQVLNHRNLLRTSRFIFLALLSVRIVGFRHIDFFHTVVACERFIHAVVILTHTFNVVVRRFEVRIRNQHHRHAVTSFKLRDVVTFFVQQEGSNVNWHLSVNGACPFLHGFFLKDTQDLQGAAFRVTNDANTVTARAGDVVTFGECRAQALTGEFHQTKAADLGHLHTSAVIAKGVLQALFHCALVLRIHHVDEVDHDQTTQVTQTHLTGHFISSFTVGAEGGFFNVSATRCTSGVDVNSDQGFGVVHHDSATRGERHRAGISGFNLVLNLETRKERNVFAVALHTIDHVRHDVRHKLASLIVDFIGVDENFADFRLEVVANSAHNQIGFFNDQEGSRVDAL